MGKTERIYRILMAALTALAAGMLIARTIAIAGAGEDAVSGLRTAFSREIVAAALLELAPLLILWGAMALAGLALPEREPVNLSPREALPRVRTACGGVLAVSAAAALAWLLNPANFASWDLEAVMGELLRRTLPWLILALIALIACGSAPASQKRAAGRSVLPARIAVGALAAVLIAAGAFNGGMRDVWIKAINICTECIGLG